MKRRTLLATSAAALAAPGIAATPALAAPGAAAPGKRVLKFIPQSDLAVLDPCWTTAYVTRNHGFMVFDTLYGQASDYKMSPQMAAGHDVSADGKTWTITLRDGLLFHDGSKVLAKDCVMSIQRWGKRDSFGQTLMAATDELSAKDDKTLVFRLKRPFPLLPDALGKTGSMMCPIMPERLAKTDPFTQITEMVGSGPYRFIANEHVPGSLIVYERFEKYQPLKTGTPSFTAGPKIVHFDRVEWHVIPDAATAGAALQAGEMDWWEQPPSDYLPLFKRGGKLSVSIQDPTGLIGCMRPNFLYPPFDNVAFRRALLPAINQTDYMTAAAGTDPSLWHVPVGVFCPGTPMANDVDLNLLTGAHDPDAVKKAIQASGYKGEKVVALVATDQPAIKAAGEVGVAMMQSVGINVDDVETDWGTVVQRRTSKAAPDKGGWNVFFTYWSGMDMFNPAVDTSIRGNGPNGWLGWLEAPKLEQLRDAWIQAPDVPTQQKIAREIQAAFFDILPYYPLGQLLQPTAYSKSITGIPFGFVQFWNVKRA
ncbi:ABC transporter substrate-binding protein [Rhodopila sp.]|uniref:ABC transporter substrate-binding protein n=1 Tax=Rhodopila sp. TaxID=2480087 RepID=UPI0038D25714